MLTNLSNYSQRTMKSKGFAPLCNLILKALKLKLNCLINGSIKLTRLYLGTTILSYTMLGITSPLPILPSPAP